MIKAHSESGIKVAAFLVTTTIKQLYGTSGSAARSLPRAACSYTRVCV